MRHITGGALVCALAVTTVAAGWNWAPRAAAQQAAGDLDVVQLRPNFYVIAGAGGNIVVQTGPEGVILVDSGSTAKADKRAGDDPPDHAAAHPLHHQHEHGRRPRRRQRQARQGRPQHPPGRGRGRRGAERRPGLQLGQGQRAGARKRADPDDGADGQPQAVPFALWPTKTFAFRHVLDVPERRRHSGHSHARRAHRRRHDRVLPPRRRDCDRRHHRHDPLARSSTSSAAAPSRASSMR